MKLIPIIFAIILVTVLTLGCIEPPDTHNYFAAGCLVHNKQSWILDSMEVTSHFDDVEVP